MPDILTLAGSRRTVSRKRALTQAARSAAPRPHLAGLEHIPVFSEDLDAPGLPQPVCTPAGRILGTDALLIVIPACSPGRTRQSR